MKSFVLIFSLLQLCRSQSDSLQKLRDLKMFYHDTVSLKGKDVYRELTHIGDASVWSKPERIDIILSVFTETKSSNEKIEILIEELYEPTRLSNSNNTLTNKTWVPNQVVYSGNTNFVKSGKIIVKDFAYQTAYFKSSLLYKKTGFRVVAIFFDAKSNNLERIEKEILFPE